MDAIRWFLAQLLWQKRTWFVVLIIAIAWALGLALRFGAAEPDVEERLRLFRDGLGPFLISAIVLMIALLYATAAFAQEIEERTIFLLLTRPYPRRRLLYHKAIAAWIASTLLSVIAVLLPMFSMLSLSDPASLQVALAYLAAAILASTAYSAIFLRVGLSSTRPMVYAAAIAIGWEGLVGTTPGNLQLLTVQHQAARFLARTVAPETWTLELPLRVPEGSAYVPAALLVAVTLIFWVVSWRRLRRFELR